MFIFHAIAIYIYMFVYVIIKHMHYTAIQSIHHHHLGIYSEDFVVPPYRLLLHHSRSLGRSFARHSQITWPSFRYRPPAPRFSASLARSLARLSPGHRVWCAAKYWIDIKIVVEKEISRKLWAEYSWQLSSVEAMNDMTLDKWPMGPAFGEYRHSAIHWNSILLYYHYIAYEMLLSRHRTA